MMQREDSLIIKNGIVVTAEKIQQADVYIVGEKIAKIGRNLHLSAAQVIDASNCYLFPGGIDPHVHMDLPIKDFYSSDSFTTGSAAALHGGTTTIIDFANQAKGRSLIEAVDEWQSRADRKCHCDYAFHASITDYNNTTRKEVSQCIDDYGITSFKTFTAYKSSLMIDDRQLIQVMTDVAKQGGLVLSHAENGDLIDSQMDKYRQEGNLAPKYHALSHPGVAEAEAVSRVIDLAYATNCPLYIVHLSSGQSLERIKFLNCLKRKSPPIFVETCPQYLLLDESLYEQEDLEAAKYVMSPPIRAKSDREALWKALKSGLVTSIGTDHCPFLLQQKKLGLGDFSKIPNGIPGVEHRMELLYSEGVEKGRISLKRFVELTSTAAAKVFGLYPRKGSIKPGADADIVIFDPAQKHILSSKTHHMNCDYSVYEGLKVKGKCWITILRGVVAACDGAIRVEKGFGMYLKRHPVL